jgi:SAM-dependent methyltransferase
MASQTPPKTLNGITYDDKHYGMHHTYNSTEDVRGWSANHFSGIDGYQRFIRLANIQPGESVLDVACRTGLVGLLACEVLGANHGQVYFVDYSETMLEKART